MKGKNKLENSRFLYTTRREETLYFVDGRKPETHYGVGKDIHYGKIPDNCEADIRNLSSRHTGYLPHFFYTVKDRRGNDAVCYLDKKIGLLRDTDKLTVKFFMKKRRTSTQ